MKMRKIFLVTFMLLMANAALAQPTIKEILRRLPDRTLPYVGEKHDQRDRGATGVNNDGNKIIGRLYTNVQLTEWSDAFEYEAESPGSRHKFIIPDPGRCLLAIRFGGVTDWQTDVLLSVTDAGEILDQMPVGVMILGYREYIPIMQYAITADSKIIVYRLEPISEDSIDLDGITSFVGNRVDRTYEIDAQGKFQLLDTRKYVSRTYTKKMLGEQNYNIYSGDEEPM